MPILFLLSLVSFAGALSIRVVDPIVPDIARDLGADPALVVLLASAFAFPYALSQPFLGPLGDAIGKARIIKLCLLVLALSLAVAVVAPSVEVLFACRIIGGLAGGGTIPLALAMAGDRFAYAERQLVLSRLLAAMMLAQLCGVIGSGLIASFAGWRAVMAVAFLITATALLLAWRSLEPRPHALRRPFSLAGIRAGYGAVLKNPRAPICYATVFLEGLLVFGVLPYISVHLEERGAGGIREAGFVLAGMGLGGLIYTLLVTQMLTRLGGMFNVMRAGGMLVAAGFLGVGLSITWWAEMAAFLLVGCGFYMLHGSLQTQATELAPDNRGAAVALHAFFFFAGQAMGPIVYSFLFDSLGITSAMALGGLLLLLVAVVAAHLLQHRPVGGS